MDIPSPSPFPAGAGAGANSSPRTITKKELVARIAERTNQTKVVAKDIIQLFLDEIIRELGNGNRLEFREFGVFEIKERAARKAQNPRTLEKVSVPAKRVVKFKVGRLMKECVSDEPAPQAPPSGGPVAGGGGESGPGGSPSGGGASGGGSPPAGTGAGIA
jgi:integration host factor subunit beta